ncbi:hypothetical protein SND95_07145, partial [Escherichia coli]|nr:hypothetical protein [Escherichia coli]
TADRNRSHWSTSKTPSYTKSVSWQHHPKSSPGMIVMACNKNYNQHEVANCLTLSYREVNRD